MKLDTEVMAELMVQPGESAGLRNRSTKDTKEGWRDSEDRKLAEKDLREYVRELTKAQRLFWANGTHALLVVLQAMDAAGKDGTIRHVMSGVNPQGCKVEAFKKPSTVELDHDFLWHSARVLPERGMIGIFSRSYYEEVLVTRVHPELLDRGKDGSGKRPSEQLWRDRFEDINAYERHLDRNGTK
jgi:polyphosphate kinase 2 (PPK2 family)